MYIQVEKAAALCSGRDFGGDGDDIMSKMREDSSLRFRFPEVDITWDEDANLLEVDNASVKLGDTVILKKVALNK